ncbi:MAG: dihydrolipoyl dehydrogenase [Deltaproteobacteria bacterium]|nr:dihydrolipoyl dehydrogenase [Deltaproteobacteria bacterium]
MKKFDTVVTGGGPGGYVSAIRLAQLGKKVGLIEKENVGGVCLNVGCIPSKAMIHASEFYSHLSEGETFGVSMKDVSLDMVKLQAWKDGVVKKLTGGVAQLLKANKVEVIKGEARFKNKRELSVKTAAGEEVVSFDTVVIATGSSSAVIPGFNIDKKFVGTSTEGLSFAAIPENLCVIGGGYIGLEIGSFYAAFGSKVTVVEATASLLPGMEQDLVQVVARELKRRKVDIHLNTKATGWKEVDGKAEVSLEKDNEKQKILVNKILVAVGRTPNTKNLSLENVGIQIDPKGFIKVNDKLQTNVDGIYAIGDCAGQPMLAHKASKEGLVAAGVIAGKKEIYDVRAMPAVIFTTPEIATVGYDEAGAQKAGFQIKIGKFPFAASGKALTANETDGFVKIIADTKTDRVLGVAIVGHDASNLIGEACLAIEMGATAEDLARTVHPHPTLTETLMEGAEAVHGTAIHIFQR